MNLIPSEENTLTFRTSSLSLEPVPGSVPSWQIEYDMPFMPEMGAAFKPALTTKQDGSIEAVLDVAHGGVWEVRVIVRQGAAELDSFSFRIDVPKSMVE